MSTDTEWILLGIKNEFFCLCFEAERWGRGLWVGHNGDNEVRDNNEHDQHLRARRADYYYYLTFSGGELSGSMK